MAKAKVRSELKQNIAMGSIGILRNDPTVGDVLVAIGEAMRASANRVRRATKRKNLPDEVAETIVESEAYLVDALIGCAFVACQACIERAVHRVDRCTQMFKTDSITWSLPLKKVELRQFGSPTCRNSGTPAVPLIHELANCFKHGHEWGWDWSKATRKGTIDTLKSAGVSNPMSAMQDGLALIVGKPSHSQLHKLSAVIDDWLERVEDQFRVDLARHFEK